jgi:hypothetical protein
MQFISVARRGVRLKSKDAPRSAARQERVDADVRARVDKRWVGIDCGNEGTLVEALVLHSVADVLQKASVTKMAT